MEREVAPTTFHCRRLLCPAVMDVGVAVKLLMEGTWGAALTVTVAVAYRLVFWTLVALTV